MLPAPVESSQSVSARDLRVAVLAHVESTQLLATLICEATGALPVDAAFAARYTPGILPHGFTLAEAESLVQHLRPMGVQAVVIAEADLPNVSHAVAMHHARIFEDALEVCDLQGRCATRILWNHLAVIAVGCVPGESHVRFMDEGRPSVLSAAPLPSAGRVTTPERPHLELWLVCRDPLTAYRLKHDEFNYETLADERGSSATENFDRFLRQLVSKAPQARRTPGTYAYLQHIRAGYEFKSSEGVQQQALVAWSLDRCRVAPSL